MMNRIILLLQPYFCFYYCRYLSHYLQGPSRSKMLKESTGDMYSLSQMLGLKQAKKVTNEL